MALRANGTAGNYLRYDTSPPNWGDITFTGFAKLTVDRNAFSTLFLLGYPTTTWDNEHFFIGTDSDGTTLQCWENSMGGITMMNALTVGRTYGIAIRNSGTALVFHVLDTVSGAVSTYSTTLPGGYVGTSMEGFRLFDGPYNEPLNGTIFGVKLFSADIGEARALNELRAVRPVNPANLHGWWPMIGNTKALCLLDYSGNGRHLVEYGTASLAAEDGGPVPWGGPVFLVSNPAGGPSPVSGTLGVTLANAILTAAGKLYVSGAGSITLANADLTAAGKLRIAGSGNVALANATLAAAGKLRIAGTAGVTLADALLTAAGALGPAPLTGAANVQLADAVLVAAGALRLAGATAVTLENATLVAAAALALKGAVSVTLADAVLTASGAFGVVSSGALAVQLADAVLSAAGTLDITGEATVQLADAILTAAAALVIKGTSSTQLEDAVLVATGRELGLINGAVNVQLADAILVARGLLSVRQVMHPVTLTPADIQQYLNERWTHPRRDKPLTIPETIYWSQRADVRRRRGEDA